MGARLFQRAFPVRDCGARLSADSPLREPMVSVPRPPLASTFSIVALDAKAKELGIAVQSHYFSVGSAVPWAAYGVGAVATQSFVEVAYGPRALALLRRGLAPATALRTLTSRDAQREVRQVGIVDARGRTAAWTGKGCIPYAGHRIGRGNTAQGNLLASGDVWEDMGRTFEATRGRLGERLVAALEAGQRAGGDARGMQSAALLVVGPGEARKPWTERKIDLRVEDHAAPIRELRRLLTLHRAYEVAGEAEQAATEGHPDVAEKTYARALRMAPGNDELLFWRGAMRMRLGLEDGAVEDVRGAMRLNPRWARLLPRIPAEQFPRARDVLRRARSRHAGFVDGPGNG